MFEDVGRISVELSNLCNYSNLHKYCPAGKEKEIRILSLDVVKSIVEDLRVENWGENKRFVFHVYNEPCVDPRLYWLIKHIRNQLPSIKLVLLTNGWYMNENLAGELLDAGLDLITFSTYSREDKIRLYPLTKIFPGKIGIHIGYFFKHLLNPGDGPDVKDYRKCFAPLCDLTIRSSGNVGLCCVDYDETVVFGNVYKESLLSIMKREHSKMVNLQKELMSYNRNLKVCKSCWRRRRL